MNSRQNTNGIQLLSPLSLPSDYGWLCMLNEYCFWLYGLTHKILKKNKPRASHKLKLKFLKNVHKFMTSPLTFLGYGFFNRSAWLELGGSSL